MRGIILLPLLLVLIVEGCCRTECDRICLQWFWGDASETKAYLDQYQHVILVRVDGDAFIDGGPHRLSMHHFKATVERSYKGDWKISEPIAFVNGLDYSSATTSNRCVGEHLVLLTNEHTNSEIGVDTGESFRYDTQFKQVLQCVFPQSKGE